MRAANAALVGNRKCAALHLIERQLPLARPDGERLDLLGEFKQALAVHLANHRDEQAGVRVHSQADVIILLDDNLACCLVEARVENRMLLQRRLDRLQRERREGQARAPGFEVRLVFLAQLHQRGDVGLVELRHARHRRPTLPHSLADYPAERR